MSYTIQEGESPVKDWAFILYMAQKKKKLVIRRKSKSGKISKFEMFRRIVLIGFVGSILGAVIVLITYKMYAADLPSLDSMNDYRPPNVPTITRIYDVHGKLIAELCKERRIILSSDAIPAILKQAVVAIEDERFYKHHGVDYRGIGRAFYKNLKNFEFSQGASTISMQVARTFYLGREKKISRKIKEALLAVRIEKNFNKEEILWMYLNQIYLGHGAYGVAAAADEYFGKQVEDLSIAECALLAGLPQKPSDLDPFKNLNASLERRKLVLDKMKELGMISDEEHKNALKDIPKLKRRENAFLNVAPYFTEYVRLYLNEQYGEDTVWNTGMTVFTTVDAEWCRLAQAALRKGIRRRDRLMGYRGPTRITDPKAHEQHLNQILAMYQGKPSIGDIVEGMITELPKQDAAWAYLKIGNHKARLPAKEKALANNLDTQPNERLEGYPKPTSDFRPGDFIEAKVIGIDEDGTIVVSLEQEPLVQGALISLDPFTGEIKAMVGGYDFEDSKYNRAIQSSRQPGSAFKPIVYTAAIDAGLTPATVIVDTPIILQGPNGPWKPKNYGGKFSGPRTLTSALQNSVNTISVRIINDIGPDMVIKYARMMGIKSEINRDLSIALGTPSLTLLEMSRANGVFATGGYLVPTISIRRVYDWKGDILENRVPEIKGYPQPPDKLDDFLKWSRGGQEPYWGGDGLRYRAAVARSRGAEVLSPQTAYVMNTLLLNVVEGGTGKYARIPGVEIAGKTGTTNKYRDALFFGYSTGGVTGVWVGYDDGNLLLGRGATGGDVAAPIWQDFMAPALYGKIIPPFIRPEGVVTYSFDLLRGTFPCPDSTEIGQAGFKDGTKPAECPTVEGQDMDIFQYDIDTPPSSNQAPPL